MPIRDVNPRDPGAFLGIGMDWPPREDPDTGDIARAVGEASVSACVRRLIHTEYEEVPMLDDMGTEASSILFLAAPEGAAGFVGESIRRAIEDYETRVQYLRGDFLDRYDQTRNNARLLFVRVLYRIKTSGDVVQNVSPFNLLTGE